MATKERDHVTGIETTGHEWDGIKELNTPLPKWWVYVFYATIVWSIGYWVVYPAWPMANGFTKGMFGYSSRADVAADLEDLKKARGTNAAKLTSMSVEDIYADTNMRNYAVAAGRTAFNENCSACHQFGGAGKPGVYPTLADDEWLWGGDLEAIKETITIGVRHNDDSRLSEMPAFGTTDPMTDEQVGQLADYVLGLSKGAADAASPGGTMFAERCTSCHGESGEGMAALGAPALNNGIWLYGGSKEAIMSQIKQPKHSVMPAWGGRLDATTIKTLAVYVRSLGGGH